MERDRQDRERTVSPFMRKGSLQIKMTSFSCAALLIPMNLQLNAVDLAQRYSWIEGVEKQYDISKYSDYIFETLKKIIDRGFGIEINTSFMKPDRNITLPRIEVIKMYKELGGEIITVGSDSHKLDRVGENIEKTYELLRECGFRYISSFKNRICEFKNL